MGHGENNPNLPRSWILVMMIIIISISIEVRQFLLKCQTCINCNWICVTISSSFPFPVSIIIIIITATTTRSIGLNGPEQIDCSAQRSSSSGRVFRCPGHRRRRRPLRPMQMSPTRRGLCGCCWWQSSCSTSPQLETIAPSRRCIVGRSTVGHSQKNKK